jgi:uncharacterized protein YciI
MFHILVTTYLQPVEIVDETRPAHVAWLNEQVAAGRILLAGRQESLTGAVLVTADISTEEAQQLMDEDPYQLAGVVRWERVSFNGSIRAPGL